MIASPSAEEPSLRGDSSLADAPLAGSSTRRQHRILLVREIRDQSGRSKRNTSVVSNPVS